MNIADLRIGREIPILKKVIIGMVAVGTVLTIVVLLFPDQSALNNIKKAKEFEVLRMVQLFLLLSIGTTFIVGGKTLKGALNPRKKRAQFKTFEARYYSAAIIRLTGVAGNVFFAGFVLLQMPDAYKQTDPTWYLHLLPLVILWVMAYYVFPSGDKIERYKQMYQP